MSKTIKFLFFSGLIYTAGCADISTSRHGSCTDVTNGICVDYVGDTWADSSNTSPQANCAANYPAGVYSTSPCAVSTVNGTCLGRCNKVKFGNQLADLIFYPPYSASMAELACALSDSSGGGFLVTQCP